MRVGFAVVVLLLTTWVLFVVALALTRPQGMSLADAKRLIPDVVQLVRALATEPTTTRRARLWVWLALLYLAMPFDVVPDFIPVLGYADDVIVVSLVLRALVRGAGPEAVERHWRGSAAGLAMVRRLCGIPG